MKVLKIAGDVINLDKYRKKRDEEKWDPVTSKEWDSIVDHLEEFIGKKDKYAMDVAQDLLDHIKDGEYSDFYDEWKEHKSDRYSFSTIYTEVLEKALGIERASDFFAFMTGYWD